MVARLAAESFDLAIIGGGINGAAIARDASLRGLKVALIDRSDFAGATSSHSSKLIHGGLRYLPQGQIRLVYHALRERERLRNITAPHLVHPMKFLMPFYRGRQPGRLAVLVGLNLYDLMAWTPRIERHRRLTPSAVHAREPALSEREMTGGALYYDGWGDDARLTLENVLDAAYHGAAVANYVRAEAFKQINGHISSIVAFDEETGSRIEIRARYFVNATGPWVDRIRTLDEPASAPSVRLTKGVHLVIAADHLPIRSALVLTDYGGRIIFLMPHQDWILMGTTDTTFEREPNAARIENSDIDYLLSVVNDALPDCHLDASKVAYAFAGLRVLPLGPKDRPSAIPREEIVLESPSKLLTIAGGKLTTHRAIAELAVNRILAWMNRRSGISPTRTTPLPGARPSETNAHLARLSPGIGSALVARYGGRAGIVGILTAESAELGTPVTEGSLMIGAEVIFSVRYELARTLADFLIRRTSMVWRTPPAALTAAPVVARLMARELDWTPAREAAELGQFHKSFNFRTAAN